MSSNQDSALPTPRNKHRRNIISIEVHIIEKELDFAGSQQVFHFYVQIGQRSLIRTSCTCIWPKFRKPPALSVPLSTHMRKCFAQKMGLLRQQSEKRKKKRKTKAETEASLFLSLSFSSSSRQLVSPARLARLASSSLIHTRHTRTHARNARPPALL